MGRSPCCEKVGLKKGPWTPEEDQKLIAYIEEFGHGSWRALPAKAGLQRCGKSCRLRWTNYLRPDIKRGKFSLQEEQTIIQLHALLGNRWSAIAAQLPRRTDNEIKNYWNTHLKKRLTRMGIDPTTHKPKTDTLAGGGSGSCGHSKDAANLSHMAQWESARLEAEARLVRESNKFQKHLIGSSNSSPSISPTRLFLNKITPLQPTTTSSSLPPCLDVLKAWQSSWSKPNKEDSNNNSKMTMMHSMYAMMLSNDDNLESPTSTLNFPGRTTLLPLPVPTNNNNAVLPFNQTLLPVPPIPNNNNIDEAWRYFDNITSKQINNEENTTSSSSMLNLQQHDDDIMAAVEAFRSSGGSLFDNNIPQLIISNNNNVIHGSMVESSTTTTTDEENLAMINIRGDGMGNNNVNLEENKYYWNSILGLVNDSDMMSEIVL